MIQDTSLFKCGYSCRRKFLKNEIDIRRSVHSYISEGIIKESESRVLFL